MLNTCLFEAAKLRNRRQSEFIFWKASLLFANLIAFHILRVFTLGLAAR